MTHTHTYIYILFLSAGVSSRLHVLAVLSLRVSVSLTPVLLSCRIVALLFQGDRLCRVVVSFYSWVYDTRHLLSKQYNYFLIEM